MACDPKELTHVPLFALLDDEQAAVLAAQVGDVEDLLRDALNRRADSKPSAP
jgi:hypothetical protein